MEELLQKLKDLQKIGEFNEEKIRELTNEDQIMFLITEKTVLNKPQYNNLGGLFDSLRETIFEKGGMNIFEEHLTIKLVYFREIYGVDEVLLQAAIVIMGPVYLDYKLEQNFTGEDDFYKYFMKRYQDHKMNNELTILKMLNIWSNMDDLAANLEKFQGATEELKKYVSDKN